MIPGAFTYHAPRTLEDAMALLGSLGEDAKILAGGQSLIPAMRFRLAVPEHLVDIKGLTHLAYVREEDGHLKIGAMTRESDLEDSPIVGARYALLADTARVIADPLVRNLATVGGNLAHADPANDHPAAMLAYGAEIESTSPRGVRTTPIDAFFTGLFENALEADEILTEIRVPTPQPGDGGAYLKLERKVGDYAISAAAVQLRLEDGRVSAARIGLTNVNPVPMRATAAEQAVIGQPISEQTLTAAATAAAEECDPSPDLRGSVAYKRDITGVLVRRAVQRAAERAAGGST